MTAENGCFGELVREPSIRQVDDHEQEFPGSVQMNRKMILGAAATFFSIGALQIPAAEAHGLYRWNRPYIVISTYDDGCGFYYRKWRDTGSFFWRRKYDHCRAI
jgi:hypothetical protein